MSPVNYRPISILLPISKIYERIIYNTLFSLLDKFKILSSHQFGFTKSCATNHATVVLTDFVTHKLDNHQSACALYLDVSKAFDSIDLNILIDKIWYYGIRGVNL